MIDKTFDENITALDIAGAKTLRSVFANRLYVTTDGGNVRLNFAEFVLGEPMYHTAITLSPVDALGFGDLIGRMAASVLTTAAKASSETAESEVVSGE